MKTSAIISAIAVCVLSVPIVSAQDKNAPDKPAMSMDMDKHMRAPGAAGGLIKI